ncbi:MAG: hypothetical protein JSR59_00150 [Proteobacteria bacterium]|nr:hypothetical protein [Pseudomonadota bacterium]
MNLTQPKTGSSTLTTALTLAQLLEHLERSPARVNPGQYRLVAERLARALADVTPGAPLQALLDASPAAAEVYENINYQHAGLCRSPLDAALSAEVRARDAIEHARRVAPAQG